MRRSEHASHGAPPSMHEEPGTPQKMGGGVDSQVDRESKESWRNFAVPQAEAQLHDPSTSGLSGHSSAGTVSSSRLNTQKSSSSSKPSIFISTSCWKNSQSNAIGSP